MNAVTQVLREEHELIRRAAACLDRIVEYAVDSDELCIFSALELLEFFEDFADLTHQAKEARHLFPALLATGLAPDRIRALVEEHAQEHALIAAMRNDLEGAAYGDGLSQDRFVTCARRFATLQREHAAVEDQVLLPLAEELLNSDAVRRVRAGFRETEAELLPKAPPYYLTLVECTEKRLGCAPSAAEQRASRLVSENISLASWMARRYRWAGIEFEDLRQAAALGLIAAAEKFDPDRGAFSTIAWWYMRSSIQSEIARTRNTIRAPAGRAGPRATSLDAQADEGRSASTLLVDENSTAPADEVDRTLMRESVETALETLRPREAQLIRLRFGIDDSERTHTLEEIGGCLGVSRERVRQIEGRVLRELRLLLPSP